MAIMDRLLASEDPAIRYLARTRLCDAAPDSREARHDRAAIPSSPRVQCLLSRRDSDGRIPGRPYAKFSGAHWILAQLAEIGFPAGETELTPLRDQVYDWLLSAVHTAEFEASSKASSYGKSGVPVLAGRPRRCGSQEGNALWSTLALGIADPRTDRLAENLVRWQWPDGGWNCDRRPEASASSFHETWLPLRALALYARVTNSAASRDAAARAAEVFLQRRLFRRMRDGSIIKEEFTKLHYPAFWHYDILVGLKVIAEAGFIQDPRCAAALDLLESKRLPDGGFPLEARYHRVADTPSNGVSLADWGGTSTRRSNEYVTVDALYVLKSAGRL